jgi:hypothetical protein
MHSEVEYIDNDTMIRVTLTMDGFVEKGYVSSMHLVDEKITQLKACIQRKAERALEATGYIPFDDPLA